jgi:hypothetical protein
VSIFSATTFLIFTCTSAHTADNTFLPRFGANLAAGSVLYAAFTLTSERRAVLASVKERLHVADKILLDQQFETCATLVTYCETSIGVPYAAMMDDRASYRKHALELAVHYAEMSSERLFTSIGAPALYSAPASTASVAEASDITVSPPQLPTSPLKDATATHNSKRWPSMAGMAQIESARIELLNSFRSIYLACADLDTISRRELVESKFQVIGAAEPAILVFVGLIVPMTFGACKVDARCLLLLFVTRFVKSRVALLFLPRAVNCRYGACSSAHGASRHGWRRFAFLFRKHEILPCRRLWRVCCRRHAVSLQS